MVANLRLLSLQLTVKWHVLVAIHFLLYSLQCTEIDHLFHLVKMVEEQNIPVRIGGEKMEAEIKTS